MRTNFLLKSLHLVGHGWYIHSLGKLLAELAALLHRASSPLDRSKEFLFTYGRNRVFQPAAEIYAELNFLDFPRSCVIHEVNTD